MMRLKSRRCRGVMAAVATAVCLLTVAGLPTGCSQDTVVLPSRNLNRPTDMTFACLARSLDDKGIALSFVGQPMGKCHPSSTYDPAPVNGPVSAPTTDFRTYAFVTNAERGDLSVIDMSYCRPDDGTCLPPGAKIVDLDPSSVGFAAAPLGELPEVITASQDGCRVLTANRGSCDLTFVNPAALLARTLGASAGSGGDGGAATVVPYARTIVPLTSTGRLAVAPGEIAFVPQQTMLLGSTAEVCDPGGVEGTLAAAIGAPAASAAAPAPWRAVVTFPSCDLIALMELPSGNILDSVVVKAGDTGYSFVHAGSNPVCPVMDCPSRPGNGGSPDAGVPEAGDDALAADASAEDAGTEDAGAQDAGADDANAGDASAPDAGSIPVTVTTNLAVGALAIHPEGNRIYFGATNARFIGALDISGMGDTLSVPALGSSTTLAGGTDGPTGLGVTRLRASVDPYAYSKAYDAFKSSIGTDGAAAARPEYGRFVAGRHDDQPADPLEFLYVIAKDGSLRVVDIGRPKPVECDLGIDPYDPKALAIGGEDTMFDDGTPQEPTRAACFEYQAPDGPRRLRSAGGPGMRFGSAPQDVAFANYRTPRRRDTAGALDILDEQVLSGAFAFVMSSGGTVYILNIDPELRYTAQFHVPASDPDQGVAVPGLYAESPRPLTHSRRDNNVITYSPALGPQNGPPRLDAEPIVQIDGAKLKAFNRSVASDPGIQDSRIDARLVPSRPINPNATPPSVNTYVYFPNRSTATAQVWGITWEGDLTGIRITGDLAGPPVGPGLPIPAPALATEITDNGSGFCVLGGIDGDVMTLTGCDTDGSCAPGNVCVHSTEVPPTVEGRSISGMCLPQLQAAQLRDDEPCRRMLRTFRRYEIMQSGDRSTIVVPRRAEVPRPAFTNAAGLRVSCEPDAKMGEPHGCQPEMSPIHLGYKCTEVKARPDGTALRETDLRWRCLQPCTTDTGCQQGRVCVSFPPDEGFCAEAAPIAAGCGLDQLFSYKIGAGGAFVVNGTASGRTEVIRPQQTKDGPVCIVDPAIAAITDPSAPELVARIPLNTPPCSAESTPDAAALKSGRWPPSFLAKAAAPRPNPCFVVDTQPTPVTSALFQNTEVRFVLTDLQKPIPDVLQIRFEVHGGFAPQTVAPSIDSLVGLPARLLLGPVPAASQNVPLDDMMMPAKVPVDAMDPVGLFSNLPYLFVVDQRQFSGGRLAGRGQILRITPRISDTAAPVAGFEGFTTSGRYFPIQ